MRHLAIQAIHRIVGELIPICGEDCPSRWWRGRLGRMSASCGARWATWRKARDRADRPNCVVFVGPWARRRRFPRKCALRSGLSTPFSRGEGERPPRRLTHTCRCPGARPRACLARGRRSGRSRAADARRGRRPLPGRRHRSRRAGGSRVLALRARRHGLNSRASVAAVRPPIRTTYPSVSLRWRAPASGCCGSRAAIRACSDAAARRRWR